MNHTNVNSQISGSQIYPLILILFIYHHNISYLSTTFSSLFCQIIF